MADMQQAELRVRDQLGHVRNREEIECCADIDVAGKILRQEIDQSRRDAHMC